LPAARCPASIRSLISGNRSEAADPLYVALEAGSLAAIELQLAQAAPAESPDVRAHLGAAIHALRSALANVRLARCQPQRPFAYGFVACPEESDEPAS
jgi:hypothetical protein